MKRINAEQGTPHLKEHIQNFLIVSVAYITAFSLVLGFVTPLQQMLLSNVVSELSVLFLPHGVRVLAFYLLGWRAAFYLLPASYLMILLTAQAGITLDSWAPVVSVIGCYVGFALITHFFPEGVSHRQFPKWQYFGLIALLGSILNSVGNTVLLKQELDLSVAAGFLIGDMAGFFACFLILMYAFRFARLLTAVNDA